MKKKLKALENELQNEQKLRYFFSQTTLLTIRIGLGNLMIFQIVHDPLQIATYFHEKGRVVNRNQDFYLKTKPYSKLIFMIWSILFCFRYEKAGDNRKRNCTMGKAV